MTKTEKKEERQPPLPEAFARLGVVGPLLKAVAQMNWAEPSEIQEAIIPVALAGKDILGQAKTGTGKTGAFGLPILQMLAKGKDVRCLILTPTRELAAQVSGEIRRLGRFTEHMVMVAYGGTRVSSNIEHLKRHPAIVVGTPGRIMDLMRRGLLKLGGLEFAVLDEVDRMLDIGFRQDIRQILGRVRHEHQTIFVSATINDEINRLSRQYMNDPVEIFCSSDKLTVDEVQQWYCTAMPQEKSRLLAHLIKHEKPEQALIFTRTRRATTRVAKSLKDAGIDAREIHGDLFQRKRDRIMESFRQGKLHVLVATDLASRGLDIDDISHVINYDIPEDPEVYVHRIGRTARMGQPGKAFTLVTPEQGEELTRIEILINCEIPCLTLAGYKAMQREEPAAVASATDKPKPKPRAVGRPARRRRL